METLLMLMTLLMVAPASGCTSDDDPHLRDQVTTTTRRPTEAENRMYHTIRMQMVKSRMLKGLGLNDPPEIPRGAPSILKDDVRSLALPNFLHMKHLGGQGEDPLSQPWRKFSRVIVFSELGSHSPCHLSKSVLRNYTPVSFKLPSDPSLIHRAILQLKLGFQSRMRAWVCPCTTPGHVAINDSNSLHPASDFGLKAAKCNQLSLMAEDSEQEVSRKSAKKGWSYVRLENNWKPFVSRPSRMDKRLLFLLDGKMSITVRMRPSLVLEVEKDVIRTNNYPLRVKRAVQELDECTTMRKNKDTKDTSSCCRTGFWVDFKELGWSDWILSPPGFHFHYCLGHCRTDVGSVLKRGALDKRMWTCCLPRKTSPLKLVLVAGRSTLNETLIPNFIVDDCACVSQFIK